MLSIAINIKNGEKYLARCLNALSKFEDIVILDNYSTDNTVAIANMYPNVRLFQAEFNGMGRVRNLLSTYAKYDWLFFIDCDEIVQQQLVDCLLKLNFADNTIYQVRRHNFYANYYVNSSSWDNDWVSRIYNRRQTQYTETDVHESVITKNFNVNKISTGFVYHFPYDNVSQLIDKMQFYSTLYAKQNFGKKKPRLYSLPLRAMMMFFKCYILKGGFRDGFEGLTISYYNAMGVFSKYIKLYELSYQCKIAIAFNINSYDEGLLNNIVKSINLQTLLPNLAIILCEGFITDLQQYQFTEYLASKLVVPGEVIFLMGQDGKCVLNNYLSSNNIEFIAHIEDYHLLDNAKFFKQCKTAILHNKSILKAKIYSKN